MLQRIDRPWNGNFPPTLAANLPREWCLEEEPSFRKILDPQGPFLRRWNCIFFLSCLFSALVDPLFLYISVFNEKKTCLDLDNKLGIAATVLRSVNDVFYMLHIILQFRTGFMGPSSPVCGRGVLVGDPSEIAKRYMTSYFLIDILAVLPLPQVVILFLIPKLRGPPPLHAKKLLRFVLFQYILRFIQIIRLYREDRRSYGILTRNAWSGAALTLYFYMLVSHVLGAVWYLFAVDRKYTCFQNECLVRVQRCRPASLYCGEESMGNNDFLNSICSVENEYSFDFGIYVDAIQSKIVQSRDFSQRLFYCFWWGLRNMSSLGQNLHTNTYIWEISFMFGVVLFSVLIGNMQSYLESSTVELKGMTVKRRDTEQWMSYRMLPENLKERTCRYERFKWQLTRGADEEHLLGNLPKDLRKDIKRHICLPLLMRVPMFKKLNKQLLDKMCQCLKPAFYTEHSFIVHEGNLVDEMFFVWAGKLECVTSNCGKTSFFDTDILKPGDYCGEELLIWAKDPCSSSNLPISTRTVRVLHEVEAFTLTADDLKFVMSQFHSLHNKQQLRGTFRFYSQQWRAWAASNIQAAWRWYMKKKQHHVSQHGRQERLKEPLAEDSGSSSFSATIFASQISTNILRRRKYTGRVQLPRLPPMLLKKPAEPDFSPFGSEGIAYRWKKKGGKRGGEGRKTQESRRRSSLSSFSSCNSIMSNWVWADLPETFVERISDICLPPDYIRMQSVCKSWQLILKKRRKRELPWLMMQNEADPDALDFFSISQQKLHTIHFPEIRHKRCIGSFRNGWLIIIDKMEFRIHLFHPWSRIELQLPCLSTSTLRRQKYVANFVVDNLGTVHIQKKFMDPIGFVSKVALSDDGNMVVAIYGCGELAFCRIGDKAWTPIESPRLMNHIQIIYHKGQFYAMEYQGPISHLLIDDNFIPHVVEVAKVPHFEDDHDGLAYFVGDILTECLFVVFREVKYNYESYKFLTTGFHIYEVVPSLNKVREVKSLGDRIMFLGCNSSLIVMAREFPSFKGNCIYFYDVHQIYDSGVFNCEDGTIEPPLVDWCHHPTTLWPPLWTAIPPYSLCSDFREKDVIGTTTGVIIMLDKEKSKKTDDIDRAHWSDGMRKCFIDICLEQVRADGRPGVQFSSKAWKMIMEKFTQRTRHSFNQKQLKNQLDHLKKIIQCLVALDITNWYRLQPTYRLCGDGTGPMDRIPEDS